MHKKRILIFPFNLMSHYLRCIALARQYSDHEILFADSTKYRTFVEKEGYTTFPCEALDSAMVMKQAAEFRFKWLNEKDLGRVFLSQLEVIRDLQPDLVIGDNSPTLKMAAEKEGVKFVALMNGYMSKYYDGVRPVSRTHYSYQYLQILPAAVKNFLTVIAERASFREIHRPFRLLRKKYQLQKTESYLEELEGDENLICDEEWLFPQKELPANYKIVGSLLYRSIVNTSGKMNWPHHKRNTICICQGSSGDWTKLQFLQKEKYAHLHFIVTGDHGGILNGKNFMHHTFVNFDDVLPNCALMICHGGNGTIYEGLKHNVFMLFVTNHFEQEWNALRLSEVGLVATINDDPEKMLDDYLNKRTGKIEIADKSPLPDAELSI